MHAYDHDIQVAPAGAADPGTAYAGQVHAAWNIGRNPNGGYLLSLAAAAVRQAVPQHVDPLSVTVHYLRPGLPGQPCQVEVRPLRSGRTLSTVRATLRQDGQARLELLAALGDLADPAPPRLTLPPPEMPLPDQCVTRSGDAQGVDLPIMDRLDIRLHPQQAKPGTAGRGQVSGWIRFRDGREPDALACLLFADAFPPAVFGVLGMVGWVPTVELTVHVRARPAPGWMLGQFNTHDLADGRCIEDGALWDSTGRLVLQSRQLALVRMPGSDAPTSAAPPAASAGDPTPA
ncbi:MAG: hypothetical protein RJA10_1978 [Pseudomonadota bacterium]|jgi:acyl-CoA thioesterase